MAEDRQTWDVFISHSSHDKTDADALVRELESRGVTCWISYRNIPYGEAFPGRITQGIACSRSLLVLLSKNSSDSEHVLSEVAIAYERDLKLFVAKLDDIKLDGGLEFYLTLKQSTNLFPLTTPEIYDRLAQSIKIAGTPSANVSPDPTVNAASRKNSASKKLGVLRNLRQHTTGFIFLVAMAALIVSLIPVLRTLVQPQVNTTVTHQIPTESDRVRKTTEEQTAEVSPSLVQPPAEEVSVKQVDSNPFGCAHIVKRRETVSIPKTYVNSEQDCDYYVSAGARITLSSDTVVEAGATFIMGEDSYIVMNGGELTAIGRENAPITFKGEKNISGFWRGIALNDVRKASLHFVRLVDAGNTQSVGALVATGSKIDVQNSHFSNSNVNGLVIRRKTEIMGFANNRFFGNKLSGLVLEPGLAGEGSAEMISMLDAKSDYYGTGNPNGNPLLSLKKLSIGKYRQVEISLKALNVPYEIRFMDINEGDTLRLEPGVQLAIPEDGSYSVGGQFIAEGTLDKPIEIFPAASNSKPYNSFSFHSNASAEMVLRHVTIKGGGQPGASSMDKTGDYSGAISLDVQGRLQAFDSTIEGSATWGIACGTSYGTKFKGELLLKNMTYLNNTLGDVSKGCNL